MKNALSFLLFAILAIGAYAYNQANSQSIHKTSSKVSTNNLLAISWQNAYCQTHQSKRECRNVNPTAYSASNFTLHGLWPQPRNRVNCKGEKRVWLEKKLYKDLSQMMPAVKSGLHKHEWKKHGTCYGKSADLYFEDSIHLLKQINNSAVQNLFAKNMGKSLTKQQVIIAFNKSFGAEAGRKMKMMCKNGLITELQINLLGEISTNSDIKSLLKNAKNAKGGCQKGKVDKVGY